MDFNQRIFASHQKVKNKIINRGYTLTFAQFLALLSVESGDLYIDLIFFFKHKE